MRKISQAEALRMEATDRRNSFPLNYARNQCGNRTFRNLAAIIADGHDVEVKSHADGCGFFIDGVFHDWKEVAEGRPVRTEFAQ